MKKYLIKVTYKATERNNNFLGENTIWYHGKNGSQIHGETNSKNIYSSIYTLDEIKSKKECFIFKDMFYTRKNKKALENELANAKRENERGYWKVNVEWIEI